MLLVSQEALGTEEFGLYSVINGTFKIFLPGRKLTREMILSIVYWRQVKTLELEKLFGVLVVMRLRINENAESGQVEKKLGGEG